MSDPITLQSSAEPSQTNWPAYYFRSYHVMKDFLVAAAAHFDIRSALPQAMATLEGGPINDNFMQLTTASGSFHAFQTYWTSNAAAIGVTYSTGKSYPATSDIITINSLNAAAALYWLKHQYSEPLCALSNYPAWKQLAYYASTYNGRCNSNCPYLFGYGVSAVLLAYGANYSTAVSSIGYSAAYYCDTPNTSATVAIARGCSGSTSQITPPSEGTTFTLRTSPLGRNANGKQLVIVSGEVDDYLSGLAVNYALHSSGYTQAVVTPDAKFAAHSAASSDIVVLTCGKPATTKLESALTNLGISYHVATSFSQWEGYSGENFINCGKSTAPESYDATHNNALNASESGY